MRTLSRQSRHMAHALHSLEISWPADLGLLVWRDGLDTPAGRRPRRVRGAYDPTLNRIELFGCTPATSDDDLVRLLLHELAHAAGIRSEQLAARSAQRTLDRLVPVGVAALAGTLRSMAQSRPQPSELSPGLCCPLSIG